MAKERHLSARQRAISRAQCGQCPRRRRRRAFTATVWLVFSKSPFLPVPGAGWWVVFSPGRQRVLEPIVDLQTSR